jgi:hypothetical protein
MVLYDSARVQSGSTDLSGDRIDLILAGSELEEAHARGDAVLVGEDVSTEAPLIRIYMTGGQMQRLVAVSEPDDSTAARPVVLADRYRLNADSIEVSAPGEVLERIFAAGRARSESQARDSLNVEELPPTARTDWIEGDTVIATFVAVTGDPESGAAASPPDSTGRRFELSRLVARVGAKSLYRLPPADSLARPGVDPPAVHYVQAAEIVISMTEGEVDRMEAEGLTQGVHLEPTRARARPDPAEARPDGRGDAPSRRDPAPDPRPANASALAGSTVPRRSR